MSLTNDMLNNLEKRRSLNSGHESIFRGLEATACNKSYYVTYSIYISLMFVVLGTLAYFTLHHLKSNDTHSAHNIKVPMMHFKTPPKMANIVIPQAIQVPQVSQAPQINQAPQTIQTPQVSQAPQVSLAPQIDQAPQTAQSDQITPIKTLTEVSTQDQALEEYQDALAFIAQNQTSAAIEKLKHIIDIAPNYQDARTTLATLYLKNNEVNDATQLLTDGLAIEPNNLPLTLLFARALTMQGHNQAALLALQNISDAAGNNTAYTDLLASVQEAVGHYAEAISLYQSLLHQDPTNNRWLISLGTALEHTEQKSAALSAYKKAIALGPLPPDLLNYATSRIHHLDD